MTQWKSNCENLFSKSSLIFENWFDEPHDVVYELASIEQIDN